MKLWQTYTHSKLSNYIKFVGGEKRRIRKLDLSHKFDSLIHENAVASHHHVCNCTFLSSSIDWVIVAWRKIENVDLILNFCSAVFRTAIAQWKRSREKLRNIRIINFHVYLFVGPQMCLNADQTEICEERHTPLSPARWNFQNIKKIQNSIFAFSRCSSAEQLWARKKGYESWNSCEKTQKWWREAKKQQKHFIDLFARAQRKILSYFSSTAKTLERKEWKKREAETTHNNAKLPWTSTILPDH